MVVRRLHGLYHRYARPHAGQAMRYLLSGGSATAIALTVYQLLLLLWGNENYLYASVVTDGVGLVTAFLFHKYLVFGKHQKMFNHAVRFGLLQAGNFFVQTGLVYAFVEFAGIQEFIAKALSIACAVCWNFILYKYFVYVE
jgi:putative flippase GtrA